MNYLQIFARIVNKSRSLSSVDRIINPATPAQPRDLKQPGPQRDDDGYSHNDIPDLVQKK